MKNYSDLLFLNGGNSMAEVTIYDVAKAADCSTATVSLVLHNSIKVKDETRKRVLEIVDQLGYTPSFAARSLSMRSTSTLGLIVPNLENPLFSQMISGVEECANANGFNLILGVSNLTWEKESFYLDMLRQKRVDGLLVFPTFVDKITEKLNKSDMQNEIPTIFCGSAASNNPNISYVKCDNRTGAYLAVDHLASIGKKNIAFITSASNEQQYASRLAGYQNALLYHDIPYNENLVRNCALGNKEVYQTTIDLLEHENVDAIFCLFDYMSISVMRAVMHMGYRIPEDIAIIGYDNIHISQFLPISLSTIDTHAHKIGQMACELLIEKFKNPDMPPKQIVLSPKLVIRESTQKM